jgi:hypothetical protein
VIADGIPYDHFLSGGIAGDCSFEMAILEMYPELQCHAYDPDSDGAGQHERYHFHRERVGYEGLYNCKNALVKLDVERAEWPWLMELSDERVTNIAQLVIELHSPHVPESGWDWGTLAWLAETHALIHMHGNNWDGIVEAGGAKCPGTIEATWVRWDLAGHLRRKRSPIPELLDMANDPTKPDHVVDWEPFIDCSPLPVLA